MASGGPTAGHARELKFFIDELVDMLFNMKVKYETTVNCAKFNDEQLEQLRSEISIHNSQLLGVIPWNQRIYAVKELLSITGYTADFPKRYMEKKFKDDFV